MRYAIVLFLMTFSSTAVAGDDPDTGDGPPRVYVECPGGWCRLYVDARGVSYPTPVTARTAARECAADEVAFPGPYYTSCASIEVMANYGCPSRPRDVPRRAVWDVVRRAVLADSRGRPTAAGRAVARGCPRP